MRNLTLTKVVGLALLALVAPSSQAQFTEDFESVSASASGTAMAGQGGWYVPPVANTNDMNAYAVSGNTLSFPSNPAGGGLQFMGGTNVGLVGTLSYNVRSQHAVTFTTVGVWNATFDICVSFLGTTLPAVNNIGSFSLQPSTTAQSFIALATWDTPIPTTTPPAAWTADFAYANATNVQTYASSGTTVPGTGGSLPPCFRGLALNTWHRWSVTWDWTLNQVLEVSVRNLSTGAIGFARPTDWYLVGGPANVYAAPAPTDIRCFVGGTAAGNTAGFDNIQVTPWIAPPSGAEYQVNAPGGAMDINGATGTVLCAANASVALSGAAVANFTDTGSMMDVAIGINALVPASGGGLVLPAGIVNVDLLDPALSFLWGGAAPALTAFPPFSGAFTAPTVPARITVQMVTFTPLSPVGFALSQPIQVNVQ